MIYVIDILIVDGIAVKEVAFIHFLLDTCLSGGFLYRVKGLQVVGDSRIYILDSDYKHHGVLIDIKPDRFIVIGYNDRGLKQKRKKRSGSRLFNEIPADQSVLDMDKYRDKRQ